MNFYPFLSTFGLILVLCFSSCYYDNEDLLYGNDDCSAEGVSFANDIQPIISTSCAISGCHVQGGGSNGIFTNYAGLKAKVDNGSFRQRVLVEQNMPPSEPLSNCQLQYLDAWIKEGAQNN